MEFTIKAGSPEKLKNGCVVAGVFAGGELSAAAKALDKASDGSIAAILARGDLDDKAGATLTLHALPGLATPRVLLVSLGKAGELTDKTYRDAVSAAARQLAGSPADDAAFCLADVDLPGRDAAWRIAQAAQILKDSTYRCDELKSKKDESKKGVKKLVFVTRGKPAADLDAALLEGEAIAEGMALAKTLGNLPGNVCTPGYLATTARKLAKEHKIKVEILERADMEKLGMGSLLSVAQGSHEPPKFIILNYKGGKPKDKPVVLVGKGITFDTGGISLKPPAGMENMTSDMGGAAAVIASTILAARLKLDVNVIATVPMAENMPSHTAQRPGDVLTQYGGTTVEIINTDAEGRLILADAIVRAGEDNPDYLIDTATLTGAQMVALGTRTPGVMGTDEFRDRVARLSTEIGENAWPMPLPGELRAELNSRVADLVNAGSQRWGGMLLAGVFLKEFVPADVQWAHIDIAGPAFNTGGPWGYNPKGGTGVPVRTILAVLEDVAANG